MNQIKLLPMVPHTAAKHLLLKQYLDRWFPILGKYHQRINFIDGFAGPGEYQGGEKGSPIIAIESALVHVDRGTLDKGVSINFVFIERNPQFAAHLRQRISELAVPQQFNVAVLDGEFADHMQATLESLEVGGKLLGPTFAFVDPFGFSGIPFDLMARILRYPKCEVFINIMVEFINRFLEHPNDSIVQHFPSTFGTEDVLSVPGQHGRRVELILNLYRNQLEKHAQFIGRFDMHGKKDQKTYSLFFASNASKGFEKMKEAMWSVDKVSGSLFSDAFPDQGSLFESMGIELLWEEMKEKFNGKTVWMSEIEQYVIEKTDYLPTHARQILTKQEEKNAISVVPADGYKRRKGTFKSDKVRICFSPPQNTEAS